jgi:hypothetical protein
MYVFLKKYLMPFAHLFLQKMTVVTLCVCILFFAAVGCDKKDKKKDIEWDGFMGTQWRLMHIEIIPTGERIILEPQDCDTCYTIAIDAEKRLYISGVSITNTFSIYSSYPNSKVLIEDFDEPFDGNLFSSHIRSVTGHSFGSWPDMEGIFLLITGDNTNETRSLLRFKQINP